MHEALSRQQKIYWYRPENIFKLNSRFLILTLSVVAPPLPDVDGLPNGTGLVVVRPLTYDVDLRRAVEDDEREIRQVDLMDLHENLLPQAWIQCRHFLLVEGIQRMVTVEVDVESLGRELVA